MDIAEQLNDRRMSVHRTPRQTLLLKEGIWT
jgi:hypothetical protein